MSRFDEMAEQLASLNLQIKHDMECAEAKVERVNLLIRELGNTGLLKRPIFLGGTYSGTYDPAFGPHDSGQVTQAALLVPEGFGVCRWDTEEWNRLEQSQEGFEPHARICFESFESCSPAEKKFLLPFVDEMLEDLTDMAQIAVSRLEQGPRVRADDYFAQRSKKDAGNSSK